MLIPSIDLMNNKAVQLEGGAALKLEREDVDALAARFQRAGETAVIDLDAALGNGDNRETVERLCKAGPCRVGGGIRSVDTARNALKAGAQKIIVGTAALDGDRINTGFLNELAGLAGPQRIIVALDTRDGQVVTDGWRTATGLDPAPLFRQLDGRVGGVMVTFVEIEGRLTGMDRERVRRLADASPVPLTVAGGVADLDDIRMLTELGVDVQVGMALYTGAVPFEDGVAAGLNWRDGLIPTITVDGDGTVLMMAMSSPESLKRTLESGDMWYWSRSRQELWRKGATSGNAQRLIGLRADCDGDTLLARVEQTGPACHTGQDSCFGPRSLTLDLLQQVVADRMANPRPGSYTAKLTPAKMRQKLIEEAGEVSLAPDDGNLVAEAADLLYFLTVILAERDIPLADVRRELERRRI